MVLIAFLIVLVCAGGFFLCSYLFYNALLDMVGPDIASGGIPDTTELTPDQISSLTIYVIGLIATTVLGIVGLVVSNIATAKKSGRLFGIIGILLGLLAPFTFFIAGGISVAQYGLV